MAGFKNRPILGFLSFAFALAALMFLARAYAAVPQIINYQGRLEDASGNLQGGSSGANFDFKFSIWNVSSTGSGTRLWPSAAPASTTHKVTSGVFDARLGDAAQGFSALDLDFNTSSIYYLQIDVYSTSSADFETLSPRQAIVASGFAINADTVDGAHAGTSANNVLALDPSGGINLPSGSSTFAGAVALNSTLNVGGVTTLAGFTFTNATGTGNLQIATLVATGVSSLQGLTFTNATGTGNIQTATANVTGQSTFASVSSTNFTASGYGTFPTLGFTNASGTNQTLSGYFGVSGQSNLENVSSTNLTASGYGTFPTLNSTNAALANVSSTNVTASGYLQTVTLNASGQSTLASVSSTNLTASGFLQGTLLDISGQTILAAVSSTNITASGYGIFQTLGFTNASGTNLTASGFLEGASLNISGASTLSTITGATTTLTGTLSANLAYLTTTSTVEGDRLILASDGTDQTLQWSRDGNGDAASGRLRFNDASSTNIVDIYPATSSGRGVAVRGRMLVGQGTSLSGADPGVNNSLFVIAEDFSDTSGGWANGFRSYAVLDGDTGVAGQGTITVGNYSVAFSSGFDSTDGAGTSSTVDIIGQNVAMSGNAGAMIGSVRELSLFQGSMNATIGAGSPQWTEVRGLDLGQTVTVNGAVPLRNIGIKVTGSKNGTTVWDALFGTNGVQVSGAGKLIFGGTGGTASNASTKGSNYIASGAAATVASNTIVFGMYNANQYRMSSTSIDAITTNAKDLGTTAIKWRNLYLAGSSTIGGTLAVATTTQFSATTTLTVCAQNNCTVPTTASTTDTVAFFASADGSATANSIIARGSIYGGQADIGEFVHIVGSAENYEAGDLLSISVAEPRKFERSAVAYDEKLVGIVTKTAGLVAGGGDDNRGSIIMALAGRLPIKVSGQNGPIAVGDYLAASDVPGYAMKAVEEGKVIAIAMEAFSGATSGDSGKILAFIAPQWYAGSNGSKVGSTLQGSGAVVQGGTSSVINNYNLDPSAAITFSDLTVKKLTVGSSDEPAGFTMFDTKTKEPFCIIIEDGVLKTIPGVCSTATSTPPTPTAPPDQAGEPPPPTSTSTLPADDSLPPEPLPSATSTPSEPPPELPSENASTTPTIPDSENASSTSGVGE